MKYMKEDQKQIRDHPFLFLMFLLSNSVKQK